MRSAPVLEALHRVVQGFALYSADHPSVGRAAEELTRCAALATSDGPVRIGIAPDHATCGDERLESDAIAQIAGALNRLEIGVLEITGAPTGAQGVALAGVLADAQKAGLSGGSLGEEVDRCTQGRVTLSEISYGGLRLGEAGGGSGDGSGDGVTWDSLIGSWLGGAEGSGGAGGSGEGRARLEEALAQGGVEEAAHVGRALLESVDAAVRAQTDIGIEEIRDLVGSLDPTVFERVVDGCVMAGDEAPIERLGELFETGELLRSLERVRRVHESLPPGALRLFRKLSQLDLGPSGPSDGCEEDEDDALETIVESGMFGDDHEEDAYTPDDYRAELDACVGDVPAGRSGPDAPLDAPEIATRKAEIAVEVLDTSEPEEDCEAVFRYLRRHIDEVIEARRFDLLTRAVRGARVRAYRAAGVECHAGLFLRKINRPRRVERILEIGAEGADLAELFGSADALISRVPMILTETDSEPVRLGCLRVLETVPEARVAALVGVLANADRLDVLRSLIDTLASCGEDRASRLIEPLLEHESATLRRLAFASISSREGGMTTEQIRRGLGDDDTGVRRAVLAGIPSDPGEPVLDALCDHLESGLGSERAPERDTYRRAAEIVGASVDGCSRLGALLDAAMRRRNRRGAACGQVLAAALGESGGGGAESLARWGRSLARLLGVVTRAGLKAQGVGA